MTKWKIREFGKPDFVVLDVNPSSYKRSKQVEVNYEQLIDGNYCRSVAPCKFKKEEFQLVWANVNQAQLDKLNAFINKKVEVVDHLLELFTAYVDGIEKQYIISGAPEQRYAIAIKVREV
jgi:hypothetical protein